MYAQNPLVVVLYVIAAALALFAVLWLLQAVLIILTSPMFWIIAVPIGALVGFWHFWRR